MGIMTWLAPTFRRHDIRGDFVRNISPVKASIRYRLSMWTYQVNGLAYFGVFGTFQ